MDSGLSSRPARRRAHICRACDSSFSCKAELLEHEQEAHTAGSGSTPSKRRSAAAAHASSADYAGTNPVKLHSVVKKTSASMSHGIDVMAAAMNLLVSREEVCKSGGKSMPAASLVQKSAVDSSGCVQQKVGNGDNAGGSVTKQTDSVSTENRQTSSCHPVVGSHDQEGDHRIECTTGLVPSTTMESQNAGSESHTLSQANVTATQSRYPLTDAASNTLSSNVEESKSAEGDVIRFLGLQRTGGMTDTAVTTSSSPTANEDDTKPPVSDTSSDISGTAVGSRHVERYEVLGTINEEPHATVSGYDDTAFTKEEATNCVESLHHGDSYPASVNNDELKLLAAVSSTRSRDIVATEPEKPNVMQDTQQYQQMSDIILADATDIVEQEVVLETTEFVEEPRRRQTKKRTSPPKSPVCVVNLPMTPHQFTSSDGAKKRMVAITVARAPRMVSVLLRNQGSASAGDKEQEDTGTETKTDEPTPLKSDNETNADIVTSTNAAVESEPAAGVLAETETAAEAIACADEPGSNTRTDTSSKTRRDKMETCLYCEKIFPPGKIAEHISEKHIHNTNSVVVSAKQKTEACVYCGQQFSTDDLAGHISTDHICYHCGRKFRQPANLRKVTLSCCM